MPGANRLLSASPNCSMEAKLFRFEATQVILRNAGNRPIVANLGPTTDELWHAQQRDRNFYTYGNMGLCSSLALGMAVSTDEQVISLDGDGSLLMNPVSYTHLTLPTNREV